MRSLSQQCSRSTITPNPAMIPKWVHRLSNVQRGQILWERLCQIDPRHAIELLERSLQPTDEVAEIVARIRRATRNQTILDDVGALACYMRSLQALNKRLARDDEMTH